VECIVGFMTTEALFTVGNGVIMDEDTLKVGMVGNNEPTYGKKDCT